MFNPHWQRSQSTPSGGAHGFFSACDALRGRRTQFGANHHNSLATHPANVFDEVPAPTNDTDPLPTIEPSSHRPAKREKMLDEMEAQLPNGRLFR